MRRVHKTTRFSPDRDTFIACTFSAAEGIARRRCERLAARGCGGNVREEAQRAARKDEKEVKGWRRA